MKHFKFLTDNKITHTIQRGDDGGLMYRTDYLRRYLFKLDEIYRRRYNYGYGRTTLVRMGALSLISNVEFVSTSNIRHYLKGQFHIISGELYDIPEELHIQLKREAFDEHQDSLTLRYGLI